MDFDFQAQPNSQFPIQNQTDIFGTYPLAFDSCSPSFRSEQSSISVSHDAPIMPIFSSKRDPHHLSLERHEDVHVRDYMNSGLRLSSTSKGSNMNATGQQGYSHDGMPARDIASRSIDVFLNGTGKNVLRGAGQDTDNSDDSGYESTPKRQQHQLATTQNLSTFMPSIIIGTRRPTSRLAGRIPALAPEEVGEEDEDDRDEDGEEESAGESMDSIPVLWSPSADNANDDATIKARRHFPVGIEGNLGSGDPPVNASSGSAVKRSQSVRSTRSLPASRSMRSLPSDRDRDRNGDWQETTSISRASTSVYRRRRPSLSGGSFAGGAGTVGPGASAMLDVEAFRVRSREAEGVLTPKQRSRIAKNSCMCFPACLNLFEPVSDVFNPLSIFETFISPACV